MVVEQNDLRQVLSTKIENIDFTPPKDQHSEYNWFSADEIVHGGFAHENAVRYFT